MMFLKSDKDLVASFNRLTNIKSVADLLEVRESELRFILRLSDREKYREFTIKKKSGSDRTIHAPSDGLKHLQRKLAYVLTLIYKPTAAVHGFQGGRGISTNADQHKQKRYVFNIDLKNFFPSISYPRVRGVFGAWPYNLPGEVSRVFAEISCHCNLLPQGAPTSPIISNIICARMDSQLRQMAKRLRFTYTRYADDITFSFTRRQSIDELVVKNSNSYICGKSLVDIIENNGFQINESKVRMRSYSERQEVTGLVVNQFPNIKREFIRGVRAALNNWKNLGLDTAAEKFSEKFDVKKASRKGTKLDFKKVLIGKINFVREIKGEDSSVYVSLGKKFNALNGKTVFAFQEQDREQAHASPQTYIQTGDTLRAHREIRKILRRSSSELFVIDNYLQQEIIDLIDSSLDSSGSFKIRFLVKESGNRYFKSFVLYLKAFAQQRPNWKIECREHSSGHGRFIVVDKSSVYKSGHSIMDLGKKGETLGLLLGVDSKLALNEQELCWQNAKIIQI